VRPEDQQRLPESIADYHQYAPRANSHDTNHPKPAAAAPNRDPQVACHPALRRFVATSLRAFFQLPPVACGLRPAARAFGAPIGHTSTTGIYRGLSVCSTENEFS